jgi:rare lipoprotein A
MNRSGARGLSIRRYHAVVLSICVLSLVSTSIGCGSSQNAIPPPQRPQALEPESPRPLSTPPLPTGKSYTVRGREYHLINRAEGYRALGEASYYGRRFHGRKTASGDRYNMHDFTAAHPTLPFGSFVKVTNLNNKRWVIVQINDRGPFGPGRVIDVSYAAAKTLGMLRAGTARVMLEGLHNMDAVKAGTAGSSLNESVAD